MTKEKEYALLDADFIIKANISRKAEDNRLLDWLALDTRYQLVCHEMALAEVSVHDNCGASSWLKEAIASGIVKQFTDKNIICELYGMYNVAGIELYRQFLEESCNSMNSSFYDTYYTDVRDFDLSQSVENFLNILKKCDLSVGSSKSLGERKAMVLLQFLMLLNPGRVYLFCSDDRGARRALYSITNVPCKSIMTLFLDMKKQGIAKETANEYFMPFKTFLTMGSKTSGNIRVYNAKGYEEISVPCQQIFDEIYEDKFDSIMTGFLKYKN